jgi:hypothetical protein
MTMRFPRFPLPLVATSIALLVPGFLQAADPARITEVRAAFGQPPEDARIMMRWWWFGPAVTKAQLDREMRLMKEGGIGGFEVQPVYPLVLDDPQKGIRNLPYLSGEFLEMLSYTAARAKQLGLRMDLTLGSGWPFGGPDTPITQAAGRLRVQRIQVAANSRRIVLPGVADGEKLIAVFASSGSGEGVAGGWKEIPAPKDGVLWLAPGDTTKEVLVFIASRTGQMVKRAAVGAEGFVFDHYDLSATTSYLKDVGDRLMKAFSAGDRPHAVFCDSLEVFASDWTGDFLAEFQKRHGYDLRPYLPALVANVGPETASVRDDWGRTLTELYEERFLVPMRDWAKANHTLFRIQNYGIPPAAVSSNSYADLPEGEGAQWKLLRPSRWASSASHLYGHQVTSSETWTWLHSPVFRATPLDMKAEADLHFLQGINQLIGHGWPYTAEGVDYPGWRFYAAAVFDDKNPWWLVMPDVAKYCRRVSFLLRQGRPANDVALYLPNDDAYAHFSAGRVQLIETLRERIGPNVIPRLLEAGYDFDFFDDQALQQVGRVDRDALSLGGNRYRIVVLPGVETMPVGTLRKLEEFARGGGILVATRRTPQTPPGLKASDADKAEVRAIVARLFEGPNAPGCLVTDESQLGEVLAGRLKPDMSLAPPTPDIGFIHRTLPDAEIYFIANTGNTKHSAKATFRVDGMQAEWWDPKSGEVSAAGDGSAVTLDLAPYESRVLVFTRGGSPAPAPPANLAAAGAIDLSSGWRVKIGDAPAVTMDHLVSWTDNERTRYFSGVASYERSFPLEESQLREGAVLRLDFGEGTPVPPAMMRSGTRAWLESPVREAAVVWVNGQRAGSVWCPPYSLDVTRYLKVGQNQLRIEVANLALNALAGHPLPDYRLLNLRYGVRFEAQDMDKVRPEPAGMLGPVRLVSLDRSAR